MNLNDKSMDNIRKSMTMQIQNNQLNRSMNRHQMKEELNINLPPNFNLHAADEKEEEEFIFKDYPRLGETNPSTNPPKKSNIVNFPSLEMERYDLDQMLNPHQNDLDEFAKELSNYREKVKNQNDEVQRLEEMHRELEGQSFQGVDFEGIRREKELLRQALQTNEIQEDDFFNKNHEIKEQKPPSDRVINFNGGGNFFEQKEVLVENHNGGYINQNNNDLFNQSISYTEGNNFNQNHHVVHNTPQNVHYVEQNQHNTSYIQNQPKTSYIQNQHNTSYIQNQPKTSFVNYEGYQQNGQIHTQNRIVHNQNPNSSYLNSNTSYIQNQPKTSFVNYEGYQPQGNVVRNSYVSYTGNNGQFVKKSGDDSFNRQVFG